MMSRIPADPEIEDLVERVNKFQSAAFIIIPLAFARWFRKCDHSTANKAVIEDLRKSPEWNPAAIEQAGGDPESVITLRRDGYIRRLYGDELTHLVFSLDLRGPKAQLSKTRGFSYLQFSSLVTEIADRALAMSFHNGLLFLAEISAVCILNLDQLVIREILDAENVVDEELSDQELKEGLVKVLRHKCAIRASDFYSSDRTMEELVQVAHEEYDSTEIKESIWVMRKRGSDVEFNAAKEMSKSASVKSRGIAARVLGSRNWLDTIMVRESFELLLQMADDDCPDVVVDVCYSLGYRKGARALPKLLELLGHDSVDVISSAALALQEFPSEEALNALLELREHTESCVRLHVAHGLSWRKDGKAAEGLIGLSRDTETKVRNWATFYLGNMKFDSQALREALIDRLEDEDDEVRAEAMEGLARRGDERVVEPLIRELPHNDWVGNMLEAAELLSDPRLHSALEALRVRLEAEGNPTFQATIENALQACRPLND